MQLQNNLFEKNHPLQFDSITETYIKVKV